jgi:hypothetical protein
MKHPARLLSAAAAAAAVDTAATADADRRLQPLRDRTFSNAGQKSSCSPAMRPPPLNRTPTATDDGENDGEDGGETPVHIGSSEPGWTAGSDGRPADSAAEPRTRRG